jgi:hypothetical protein
MVKFGLLLLTYFGSIVTAWAQSDSLSVKQTDKAAKKWYESFSIRGYAQVRYNRLLETNEDLGCEQCDRSWGRAGGFFIRRARIVFSGQISKRIYFYFQPDLVNAVGSDRLHFAQLRDAYFDVGLDTTNEFRFRVGQSKVPFGFENMQSSQNRLPLDRNDALNSAVANERDLGVFFYWAPAKTKKMFSELVKSGLKGTGDYGVVGLGIYNGQTANTPELNEELHIVGRISYPVSINKQVIEAGIQAYSGKYVIPAANVSSGVKYKPDLNYTDQRIAASFTLYPKPIGLQAEYNVGEGPEFNKATDSIEVKSLQGGYILLNYQAKFGNHILIPFARYQYYEGGKKHERDARSYKVNDAEVGIEWQPMKEFELVVVYTVSKRRYEDFLKQDNYQTGSLLRVQAQVNF